MKYYDEVMARAEQGNPYGYHIPDCGELSAAWYVVLEDHGHQVRMMVGTTKTGEDHAWLEVDGEVFDPLPETNPGVAYEDGYEVDPTSPTAWPSINPYRTRPVSL